MCDEITRNRPVPPTLLARLSVTLPGEASMLKRMKRNPPEGEAVEAQKGKGAS